MNVTFVISDRRGRRKEISVSSLSSAMQAAHIAASAIGHGVFDLPWCLAWTPEAGVEAKGLDWLAGDRPVIDAPARELLLGVLPMSRSLWN